MSTPPAQPVPRARAPLRRAIALLWLIAAGACSSQKEPAQLLMHDIEATLAAASVDGGKYVPEQVAAVQTQVAQLNAAFQQRNYDEVVTEGPEVLVQTQNLAAAAVAAREAATTALNDQWTGLAAQVPAEMSAVRARIASLSKVSPGKAPSAKHRGVAAADSDDGRSWVGIDAAAATTSLAEAQSLWSKAQAAFATGNLTEAVKTAADVKTRIDAVAVQVNLELPPEAQTPPR